MAENILQWTRAKVFAMGQQGILNINSLRHWDICNALRLGKTQEQVAEEFKTDDRAIRRIKACKCPE